MKLHVVVCSTRPGRVGLAIGQWFAERARAHARFDVLLVDLKEVGLPLYDEPNHPRLKRYEQAHTKAWSALVGAGDAFVFVTPEYNYAPPPSLVNAIDYLFHEWGYKPAGFVSYGGVSGGTRAVQVTKQLLTTLKVMPIPEAVTIPMVAQHLDEGGAFKGGESFDKASGGMLDELHRWASALAPLRA